jgi:prepilin-type N-terminal cleavage/methylation domain-containing protein
MRGFSLLELLITMSIVAVLAVFSVGYYRNYVRNVEFEATKNGIMTDLRDARAKAMAGTNDKAWGVRFWNSTRDFYEESAGAIYAATGGLSTTTTVYLPPGITFVWPTEGNYQDIIFSKIAGTTTAATTTITFEGLTKTVNISTNGTIY